MGDEPAQEGDEGYHAQNIQKIHQLRIRKQKKKDFKIIPKCD
jgi:hypothetical protein|tara:strand:+ start:524 stop:649 length:126 start_codon:yes stop_codon:yes gene_type:complete